jgi:hypothetical protein
MRYFGSMTRPFRKKDTDVEPRRINDLAYDLGPGILVVRPRYWVDDKTDCFFCLLLEF